MVKSRILAVIFIVSTSHVFAVSPAVWPTKVSTNSIKASYVERKVANNFLRLYRVSLKGILNKNLLKQLDKDISKTPTFKDYRVWSKGVLRLVNLKTFKALKDSCTFFKQQNYQQSVQQMLNNKVSQLCFQRYLKELGQKKKLGYSFHKLQNTYIKNNIDSILIEESILATLLIQLKDAPKLHKLYSKTLTNHYMALDKTPSLKILKNIEMTPELTRYVQSKDITPKNTHYVFFKELKKLKDLTEDALNNNQPKHTVKKHLATLLNYYKQTYEYQPKDRSTLNIISIGKDFTRAERFAEARQVFLTAMEQPGHKHLQQAKFELIWTYILNNDYDGAYKYAYKPYLRDDKTVLDNSKLSFWIANVLEKNGRKAQSEEMLQKVIKENPLSYYAILSAKKLSKGSAQVPNSVYLKTLNPGNRKLASADNLDKNWLKRIKLWAQYGSYYFLSREIESKENSSRYDQHILQAAYLLSESENYLESFKVIIKSLNHNHIAFSKDLLKILFPTPYFHKIKKQTVQDFDPIIALSLIRQESGFNRRARSHVGARGLMQLMPATARRFKRRLKTSHLYNADTNIKIGTKYFNNLLERYDNNLVYSLAAYNAGEHRVDRWQSDFLSKDEILKNIENIPYRETRKYVKLIFRNIFFYKLLLQGEDVDKSKYNQIFDLHLGFNK